MEVTDCDFTKLLEIGTVSTHFEACCLVWQLLSLCECLNVSDWLLAGLSEVSPRSWLLGHTLGALQ